MVSKTTINKMYRVLCRLDDGFDELQDAEERCLPMKIISTKDQMRRDVMMLKRFRGIPLADGELLIYETITGAY